ncbi:hypothetical protein FKM82_016951 [Ascaphus truei]
MAEEKSGIQWTSPVSRLSKALSHTHLDLLDQEAAGTGATAAAMQPPALPPRVPAAQTPRKRRLSSSQSLSGSLDSLSSIVAEARVLVINTGGTIGMMYQNEVLAPQANAFAKALKKLPILHDELYAQQTKLYDFHDFPENTLVCLYFHHKLYRGNRVTKVDAGSFNAFSSPNLPPLANAEVDITINWETVWRANTTKKFLVHTDMNRNVGLLRIFPGITAATVKAFLQPPMEGIVLETYGTGNAPDARLDLLEELKKATERGVAIINCTQCLRGSVTASYATGKALTVVGVIPGCDLTPEAALAKLSYVLGKNHLSQQERKQMLFENLRGEMTVTATGAKISLRDSKFIQVIAKSVGIGCKEELEAVRDALTPALACAAAKTGDINALEAIRDMGGNLSSEDYDGRTPLHVASCEGHFTVVQYLLNNGATVYAKDRYGDTPLMNAVKFRQMEVIRLLRQTGAHLSWEEVEHSGTELCSFAANGDVDGLAAWEFAGADMDQTGYDGQTPYQVAEAAGNKEVLEFLNLKKAQVSG